MSTVPPESNFANCVLHLRYSYYCIFGAALTLVTLNRISILGQDHAWRTYPLTQFLNFRTEIIYVGGWPLMSPYPWHIDEQRLSSVDLPCAQPAEPQPRQSRRQSEDADFSITFPSHLLFGAKLLHQISTQRKTWKMKHDTTQTI